MKIVLRMFLKKRDFTNGSPFLNKKFFPFNFQVQRGNWKHNIHLSKSLPWVISNRCRCIPFQYWEKRNVQKIFMYYYLPTLLQYNIDHTSIIIIHYLLHTIRIFYQTLCSYIKFAGPCTKYKFIVAVISPFFIWMTIFERSMKKVPCVLELLSHGLIYPA